MQSVVMTLITAQFYLFMFFAYAIVGSAWGWLCYKHVTELLPIQVSLVLCTRFI